MKQKFSPFLWVTIGLAILLIIAIIAGISMFTSQKMQNKELEQSIEELKLNNEQLQLAGEVTAINSQFAQYEDQARQIANDSIISKYNAAKQKVEQLKEELKNEKNLSRKRISELQNEINTLRGLLRHYIAQIDSLNRENAGLRAENQEIKNKNEQLSSQVSEVTRKNENLSQRMELAEKLNVTGVNLTALNSKGKNEKNITKAKQLMVTFTIPQNNSTPVGHKTIYLRLTNPEGTLLGSGGSFPMDGGSVACSARKTIDYTGDELSGITIYWDVNTTLTPGDYTVELFTDGYRLTSRHFTMKK